MALQGRRAALLPGEGCEARRDVRAVSPLIGAFKAAAKSSHTFQSQGGTARRPARAAHWGAQRAACGVPRAACRLGSTLHGPRHADGAAARKASALPAAEVNAMLAAIKSEGASAGDV